MVGIGGQMLCLQKALHFVGEGSLSQFSIKDLAHSLIVSKGDGLHALYLCAYVYESSLEVHRPFGNYLVSMLVEVGLPEDTCQVFDRLVFRNEDACNSLISGFVKCGKLQEALLVFQRVQQNGFVQLSSPTLVAFLKACKKLKDVEQGYQIHAHICKTGVLSGNVFVGSALLDMYAKCGLLVKAQVVFDEVESQNVVSWTALIAGYAEHGHGDKALECFKEMQLAGLSPNAITFVCILKACGSIKAASEGDKVHAEAARQGLPETNVFVGSALVDMYAKCAFIDKAKHVFDKLPFQDVVSWTALITGHAENGYGEEALELFEEMQSKGVQPNGYTYASCLRACGNIGAIAKVEDIHSQLEIQGFLQKDILLGSILVDIYSRFGLIVKAQQAFDNLPSRDVISWTALLAGYAEQGKIQEALHCFDKMQQEGFTPDALTLVCILKACVNAGTTERIQEIYNEIKKQRLLQTNLVIGNTLVDLYAKCGSISLACEVFEELPSHNLVCWNSLITGFVEHGHFEEAIKCFKAMKLESVIPDAHTVVCSLKACSSLGDFDFGGTIIAAAEKQGLPKDDLFVGSTLVDFYARHGSLEEAQNVFDKILVRDTVLWNSLISGYVNQGSGQQAINCYDQMQVEGVSPNAVSMLCSLKACGSTGAANKGQDLHTQIERCGLIEREQVGNSVVDMYVKCGLLARALEVFNRLPSKDVITWTSLMTGYIHYGDGKDVFVIFDRMLGEGIKPNAVTFVVVLSACSHECMYGKSETYFEAMSNDYGLAPTLEHHNCVVHLLTRGGQVEKAADVILRRHICPDLVMWRAMLGACRTLGIAEFGKQAFKHAVHLDEKNAAAYVLVSQILASAGLEEKAGNLDAEMLWEAEKAWQ